MFSETVDKLIRNISSELIQQMIIVHRVNELIDSKGIYSFHDSNE